MKKEDEGKNVCKTASVAERGGGGEGCLHRPITKRQALRQGPIATTAKARFHGDDAGMVLLAY